MLLNPFYLRQTANKGTFAFVFYAICVNYMPTGHLTVTYIHVFLYVCQYRDIPPGLSSQIEQHNLTLNNITILANHILINKLY